MNELREQIQAVLTNDVAGQSGQAGWSDEADRILALIAEAMLSEEAVEAAALDNWEHGGYASAYEDIATAMRRSVREIIGYGLTAAGITGAGQEGGE